MNGLQKALAEYNSNEYNYYFSKNTMKFFSSRISKWYYEKEDGSIYFGESVKPPHDKRIYSVLCLRNNELYRIDKEGKKESEKGVFERSFYTMREARNLAKRIVYGK